jgi:hypothetical protein
MDDSAAWEFGRPGENYVCGAEIRKPNLDLTAQENPEFRVEIISVRVGRR